ncbi:hypothetical protein RvY_09437-2 [Ramazzottius varieornatus]|nr:hypothetical protein RvY_09437-2 [Ramazzottius varieornatus]
MTVVSAVARHRHLKHLYLREAYACADGGEVILDWLNPESAPKLTSRVISTAPSPTADIATVSDALVEPASDTPVESASEVAETAHIPVQVDVDASEPFTDAVVAPAETGSSGSAQRPSGVVLILPGLTGDSSRNYIQGLAQTAQEYGYTAVVLNYRGCAGSLKTPKTYCAADTTDIANVVQHIRAKYPEVPVLAIGISLGGVLITNYIADCGKKSTETGLIGAMVVSAPWNIVLASEVLEQPVNWYLFNRILARDLCKNVNRNAEILRPVFDITQLDNVKTIRDFDDKYTAKMFGYTDVNAYYASATLHTKVGHIKTPVLALNAADDVFSPYEGIPKKEASENPNLCIVVTSHGGHIGFLEGWNAFGKNYVERLFAQFATTMFDNYKQLRDQKSEEPAGAAEELPASVILLQ